MKSRMIAGVGLMVAIGVAFAGSASAQKAVTETTKLPSFVVPGPNAKTISPASGKVLIVGTEEMWRQMCGGAAGRLSSDDLADIAANHWTEMAAAGRNVTIVNNAGSPVFATAGLDVVYVLGPSVPAAAVPAFAAAEAYLESQFPNDPFTLTVSVSFASLQSGVIGGTSSSYVQLTYPTFRSAMVAGADGNDVLPSFLPTSTIPVRYRTNKTTAENRIFLTTGNWKALGGTTSGNDASMQYSTNFPFDFDPSNGVTGGTISLQDVIIHETGHSMGFTSGVDFRLNDIEAIDAFRFRNTDGSNDFNPDTNAEFTTAPRWGVYNNPNDDVNFDLIAIQYLAADGSPYQASHFRETGAGNSAIGIMEPAFSYGETFYPNMMRQSDIDMFDAIGYNR